MYFCQYTIDQTADEPIMLLLRQIGNTVDEFGNITEYGICGADFCSELLYLDTLGKKRIQIWINSIGGSVVDAYSILGGMLKTVTPVDTCNIGVAASSAGWLFEAGRNRDMSDYATWMGHNPHSTNGDQTQILEKFRESIIKIIAERTGKDEDGIGTMLDKETYLNADECLIAGFCDTITVTSRQNVTAMTGAKDIVNKFRTAAQIINKAGIINKNLPHKKQDVMSVDNKIDINITNKLGLDVDASAAMVAKSISSIQDKLTLETGKREEAEDALKIANKAKTDLQTKYDNLVKEMNQIKADMDADEAENRLNEAKNMVNSFAELGKIENKAEIIEPWVDLAKGSKEEFDRVNNMLTSLPVNKAAKKIDVVNTLTGTGGAKNLSQKMHEISKKHNQK